RSGTRRGGACARARSAVERRQAAARAIAKRAALTRGRGTIPSLAGHTQDDGFHEIQLNGKQLVFLFMAATVVSVVIFLCGVLVGRGVRVERGAAQEAALAASAGETTPQVTAAPAPAPAGSDPTAAAPPPAVDDLTYFNRLEKQKLPAEQLEARAGATTSSEKAVPSDARN